MKMRGLCLLINIEVEFNIYRQVFLISVKFIFQFVFVSVSIVFSNFVDDVMNINLVVIWIFDVFLSKWVFKII